jgi:hypothetical protein
MFCPNSETLSQSPCPRELILYGLWNERLVYRKALTVFARKHAPIVWAKAKIALNTALADGAAKQWGGHRRGVRSKGSNAHSFSGGTADATTLRTSYRNPTMISEGTLRALLAGRTEVKNLDYKQAMDWHSASNEEKCELTKDILAMMNTQDGGRIIIGVEDKSFNAIGLTDADFQSFDPTKVNDFVHRFADPLASCEVQKLIVDSKKFVVIDVPEFADIPIICKADANSPRNSLLLKRGGLYIRTAKPSSELLSSAEDMRDLVSRAMLKRGDQLLRTIQGLLAGRPLVEPNEIEKYKGELERAKSFFAETWPEEGKQRGYWELVAMPTAYSRDRIPNIATLAEAIARSEVALRGWNFPHTDNDPKRARNFPEGCQSFTGWNAHFEGYRAYTSGLFVWRGTYWENSDVFGGPGARELSWVNVIFQITEFFVFLSRYFARVADDAALSVTVRLTDTGGRHLISREGAGPLPGEYACQEDQIEINRTYSVSQLRASPEDAAGPVIRRIFEIFQWTAVRDELIQQRQRQLIERRFQ